MISEPSQKLYSYLTQLDFFKDFGTKAESAQRNMQKDTLDIEPELLKQESIDNVPLHFPSVPGYIDLWKKLFFIETRAQILKGKEQEGSQFQQASLQTIDLIEKFWYVTLSPNKQPSKGVYGNSCLVLLYLDKPLKNDFKKGHNEQSYAEHVICVTEPSEGLRLKFKHSEGVQAKVDLIKAQKVVYIQKLCLMSTVERQFYALQQFPHILMNDVILKPDIYKNVSEDRFQIPHKLDVMLKQLYNQSQYRAIHQSLKKEGITLIQGPPGTGKTKTVLGTISVLINSINNYENGDTLSPIPAKKFDKQKYFKKNPWLCSDYVDWRDQIYGDEQVFVATKNYLKAPQTDRQIILKNKEYGVVLPERILICGPSNASVDQIIRKILSEGLIDDNKTSNPTTLVRIGDHYDVSLQHVTLDVLANKYLADLKAKGGKEDLSFCRRKILRDSKVVCGTLSSAGHPFVRDSGLIFDTVIIDQACQAVEISTLIPLTYGCKRLILIGDPNQLPSTVFSIKSIKLGYDLSLFQRMMKAGYPVNMLKTQYRMHPDVSKVVGQNFYQGLLNNTPSIKTTLMPEIEGLGAFMFLHVQNSSEVNFKRSYRNKVEAEVVKELVKYLVAQKCDDIGILSPYSQQISLLQSMIQRKQCQIKTIDSFQGREKSIVIFNTVRASLAGEKPRKNNRKTIGFLKDKRRINVGLSRAKHCCIIVGDALRLSQFETWSDIVQMAMQRRQLFNYVKMKNYFESFRQDREKFVRLDLKAEAR